MDFRTAVGRLTKQITTEEIAEAIGMSKYTIRQARLHPGSDAYRSPPDGWQRVVARLARERGDELQQLADELERLSEGTG